jgi:hypothetical protein
MIRVGPTKKKKNKVSSANNKCEIFTVGGLEPTKKPKRKPLSTIAVIILLRASMTITKRKGDSVRYIVIFL